MAVIENVTFRLAPDADEAAFLAADKRLQVEVAWRHEGFARRTTARAGDGEWLVATLWGSAADAEAAETAGAGHPAALAFDVLVDPASRRVRRYETLD